jgi:hypothetical protein
MFLFRPLTVIQNRMPLLDHCEWIGTTVFIEN